MVQLDYSTRPERPYNRYPLVAIASSFIMATILGVAQGAIANPNFGRVRLAASGRQSLEGYTGGSFSLSEIAREDQNGNRCIGYADSNPDHILELAAPTGRITLEVNSGHDTTLVVQGPDGSVYCGDDEVNGVDALVRGRNWSEGDYQIWVGSFDAGARYDYVLNIN